MGKCSQLFVVMLAVIIGGIFWGVKLALYVPPDPPFSFLSSFTNMSFIQLNDGRIMEYHQSGDINGKPILCIQGTLQTGSTICKMIHTHFLSHGLRAICPTLPGYGYSTWNDYSVPDYSLDIVQLADHLGIKKFDAVAGWSGGGLIATSITSELPKLVGNLLLVVAAPPDRTWYDYGYGGQFYLWLSANSRVNELVAHFLVLPLLRMNCIHFFKMNSPPEELKQLLESGNTIEEICKDMLLSVSHCERGYTSLAQRWFVTTSINWDNISGKGFNRKVWIVYGENDELITPKAALKYHEHIPGSTLYCFQGAGHAIAAVASLSKYIGLLWGEHLTIDPGTCP